VSGQEGQAPGVPVSGRTKRPTDPIPAEIMPRGRAPIVETERGIFDLEDPELPEWIEKSALISDRFPYKKRFKGKKYDKALRKTQVELVKLQRHIADADLRIVALFEGRDAAGKGGAISTIRQYMSRRIVRTVALPKPTEREQRQWYFQRYVDQLPATGEMVLFDRSWYNRAGVERVMGFCDLPACNSFLAQSPDFERMLVRDGFVLFKFWLNIGQETQLKRFHARRHNPLKVWKLSPMDFAAFDRWDAYTQARDEMFEATHTAEAPWTVVRSNDKHRARIGIIRHILAAIDYPGKNIAWVGAPDPLIVGTPDVMTGPIVKPQ
jgi:polyphosphate kinase 2